jgi:hypothetical protein
VDFSGEGERLAVRPARRELGGEFHAIDGSGGPNKSGRI